MLWAAPGSRPSPRMAAREGVIVHSLWVIDSLSLSDWFALIGPWVIDSLSLADPRVPASGTPHTPQEATRTEK